MLMTMMMNESLFLNVQSYFYSFLLLPTIHSLPVRIITDDHLSHQNGERPLVSQPLSVKRACTSFGTGSGLGADVTALLRKWTMSA